MGIGVADCHFFLRLSSTSPLSMPLVKSLLKKVSKVCSRAPVQMSSVAWPALVCFRSMTRHNSFSLARLSRVDLVKRIFSNNL